MAGTGSLQASVDAPAAGPPAPREDEHEPEDSEATVEAGVAGPAVPRWLWWAALAVVALPFVASAVSVFLGVGGDYHPGGDVAGTEMHVRDVGRYELLVGPFSRDGWHHPGPALFYVLALPYRALGSSPAALAAGALLVNALSLAGMAAIAKRRGGTPLLLCTLLASALMVRALGFEFLAMAWNPWVTVLPYGLLVMLTWSMACGDRWALPLAALVATFVVQTHVGYALLALPLVAVGVVWLVAGAFVERRAARRRAGRGLVDDGPQPSKDAAGSPAADTVSAGEGHRLSEGTPGDGGTGGDLSIEGRGLPEGTPDDRATDADLAVGEGRPSGSTPHARLDGAAAGTVAPDVGTVGDLVGAVGRPARRLRWAVLTAVVVVVAAWLPPVLQQLTDEPGNLGVILRWFGERSEDAHELVDGWRVVTAQYGLWPEWLAGRAPTTIVQEPVFVDEPLTPVLLLLVAVAAVAGWRRPGGDARRLVVVWLLASALGIVAVARTIGLLYAYRLSWTWPLGAIAGAYCLWVGWAWLAARFPHLERRALIPGVAVAVVVVTGIDVVMAARAGAPQPEESAVIGELGHEVADALPTDAGPLRVVPTSFLAIGYGNGLMVELERRGFDPRRSLGDRWVTDHRESPDQPWGVLMVVADAGLPAAWDDPELEMIAYVSELTPDEVRDRVARLERAEASMAAAQDSGGTPDPEALTEIMASANAMPPGTAVAVFRAPSTRTPPPDMATDTPSA